MPVVANDKEHFHPAASKKCPLFLVFLNHLYFWRSNASPFTFPFVLRETRIIICKEKRMEYNIHDFPPVCGMTHLNTVPEEMGFCSLL